jgi:hypothetical protein
MPDTMKICAKTILPISKSQSTRPPFDERT